jgi:hypothetical protein
VRILPGVYEEKLRIDGSINHWPEGVVVRGEGEVVLTSPDDEPVIRMNNVSRFTIENIQIDAKDRPVAVELSDDLNESHLTKVAIRGFSKIGILCKGVQGLRFGDNQFVIEDVSFEPSNPEAVGVRLEDTPTSELHSIKIRGCRFLGPMAAGVVIQVATSDRLNISECIFNQTTDGLRIGGQPLLKQILIINNSFRNVKNGIRFAKLPNGLSSDLMFRRNLFTGVGQAEVLIQSDYDEGKLRAMFSSDPAGLEQNWSDRPKSGNPSPGEAQFIFENGRQGESGFAFASTDPKNPRFLAPSEKSAQKEVPGTQPLDKSWVGAVGP